MSTELHRSLASPLEAAARFSPRTRRRLERALGRRALMAPSTCDALRHAVNLAVAELIVQSMAVEEIEPMLRRVAIEAGVVHGAFGASLVTRVPRWNAVEADVSRWTRAALAREFQPSDAAGGEVQRGPRSRRRRTAFRLSGFAPIERAIDEGRRRGLHRAV